MKFEYDFCQLALPLGTNKLCNQSFCPTRDVGKGKKWTTCIARWKENMVQHGRAQYHSKEGHRPTSSNRYRPLAIVG